MPILGSMQKESIVRPRTLPTAFDSMKRGFLLRAKEKKGAAKRPGTQKQAEPLALSKSVSEPWQVPQNQEIVVDKPRIAHELLPSDNLTEEEKAFASDYKANIIFKESDAFKTEFSEDARTIATIPQPALKGEIQCEWLFNGSTKAKVLNAPGYPSRIPKPSRPDLYEVRSTPEMGDGLFSKRNIKRREIILAERPLLVAPIGIGKLEQSDHYTKLQMQQILMSEFEMLLERAIGRLPSQSQADFRALHNAHTGDGSGPLLGIMRSNSYTIGNLYDVDVPTCAYAAVCKIGSRINHSCLPNVRYYFKINSFSLQFYAIRDIEAGEQLFYSYCPPNGSLAVRQADLAPYRFVCKCSACVNATPATDELRIAYVGRIQLFTKILMEDPSEINDATLEDAVKLEEDMTREGLDTAHRFGELLASISLLYRKLGKLEESEKYSVRVKEFRECFKEDE